MNIVQIITVIILAATFGIILYILITTLIDILKNK